MQHLTTTEENTKKGFYQKKEDGNNKRKISALVAQAVKKASVKFQSGKKGGGKGGDKDRATKGAKGGKGGKGNGGKATEEATVCNHCFAYHPGGKEKCYHHPSFKGTKPDYVRTYSADEFKELVKWRKEELVKKGVTLPKTAFAVQKAKDEAKKKKVAWAKKTGKE